MSDKYTSLQWALRGLEQDNYEGNDPEENDADVRALRERVRDLREVVLALVAVVREQEALLDCRWRFDAAKPSWESATFGTAGKHKRTS